MRSSSLPACLALLLLVGCASGGPKDRTGKTTAERPAPTRYKERGLASWYGGEFNGRRTANGEVFDMEKISAAHKTLPFGTVVRVRNLDNGRTLDVRINDRGPFVKGRIIDLSKAAARKLDMLVAGVARVEIRVVDGPRRAPPPTSSRAKRETVERYRIQVGAFRERERARQMASDLESLDRRFAVYSADGWHRVQARGLEAKEVAELERRLGKRGVDALVEVDG